MTEQDAYEMLRGYLDAGHGTAFECSCEPVWDCFERRLVPGPKRYAFAFGERMKIEADCLVMLALTVKAAVELGVRHE